MKQRVFQLDNKHELHVRRNDADGAVLELWYIEYRNEQEGERIKRIGDLFTFYDPEYTAEWTVPHWEAKLYFQSQHAIGKDLGQSIGRVLLEQTSCAEPMILTAYPYLPYDNKLEEKNLSFAIDFGDPMVPD